jgi:hypothetical protein
VTDRDALLAELAGDVTALVEPRRHVEPYRMEDPPGSRRVRWFGHCVAMPSLLDQLRAGGASAGEGGSRGFESKPPFALDCFDRLLAIEAGSAWWVSVGAGQRLRERVEDNLRMLVGLATRADEPTLGSLTTDVHRWRGWASVLTGWTIPPFRPRASCPVCSAKRGTLRVRPDERTAACMHCGSAWDSVTFGVLVEHIRSEGERRDAPNEQPVR